MDENYCDVSTQAGRRSNTYFIVFGNVVLRPELFRRLCFLQRRLEPSNKDLAGLLGRRMTAVGGHPLVGCVGVEVVFIIVGGPAGEDAPLDLAPAGAEKPLYKPQRGFCCTQGLGGKQGGVGRSSCRSALAALLWHNCVLLLFPLFVSACLLVRS